MPEEKEQPSTPIRPKLAEFQKVEPQSEYVEDKRLQPRWAVILKMPPLATVRQYEHMIHDPSQRADAQRTVFETMVAVAWTTWDGECSLEKLLSRFPLVHNACSEAVSDMLGLDAKPRGKG